MGQIRKTQAYADEAVSDFGTRLKKLQVDVNRRLAEMKSGPLAGFGKDTASASKSTAMPPGLTRYRSSSID